MIISRFSSDYQYAIYILCYIVHHWQHSWVIWNKSCVSHWPILPAQDFLLWSCTRKTLHRADYQSSSFLDNIVRESQKVTEDSKNRKRINDCCGPIVLQTQLAIFLSSWKKQVIHDSYRMKLFWYISINMWKNLANTQPSRPNTWSILHMYNIFITVVSDQKSCLGSLQW